MAQAGSKTVQGLGTLYEISCIIMLTGYGSITTAFGPTKLGAIITLATLQRRSLQRKLARYPPGV